MRSTTVHSSSDSEADISSLAAAEAAELVAPAASALGAGVRTINHVVTFIRVAFVGGRGVEEAEEEASPLSSSGSARW